MRVVILWVALEIFTHSQHFQTCVPRASLSQTLYKGRLCKCKPRALDGEGSVAEGTEEDKQDFFAGIARSFSELIGLCRTWAKDTALSSLALEGALCCLRSLKGRPAKGKSGARKTSNGDDEALDGALHALSDAVTDFFGKRRGGGFSPVQVCNMDAPGGESHVQAA